MGYGGLEATAWQGVEMELCCTDLFRHVVHGCERERSLMIVASIGSGAKATMVRGSDGQ